MEAKGLILWALTGGLTWFEGTGIRVWQHILDAGWVDEDRWVMVLPDRVAMGHITPEGVRMEPLPEVWPPGDVGATHAVVVNGVVFLQTDAGVWRGVPGAPPAGNWVLRERVDTLMEAFGTVWGQQGSRLIRLEDLATQDLPALPRALWGKPCGMAWVTEDGRMFWTLQPLPDTWQTFSLPPPRAGHVGLPWPQGSPRVGGRPDHPGGDPGCRRAHPETRGHPREDDVGKVCGLP